MPYLVAIGDCSHANDIANHTNQYSCCSCSPLSTDCIHVGSAPLIKTLARVAQGNLTNNWGGVLVEDQLYAAS